MTKSAQVVQHLKPGGIETMVLDLANFSHTNQETCIISLEGDRKSALKHWPRLKSISNKITFLHKKSGISPLLIYKLYRTFKKLKIDSVHTHHIGPLLYAGIAARMAGIKTLIHTEHDAWHLKDTKRRILQRWVIRLTQPLLIADATTVAEKMKCFLNINNVLVIHNGIDTEYFTPGDKQKARHNLNLDDNIKLIGCSGRLEKVKGQKVLIYALEKLPNNIHLALAGIGTTENELRSLVKLLKLEKRVHFLGRIDDMPVFYRALDIFCLPSLNEGFPLSPLEAQSCNIPTVVTNVGGSSETLCPNTGKLIPAKNIEVMATTLLSMLQLPGIKSKTSPRNFVIKQCDIRRMIQDYANLQHKGGLI